MTDEHLVLTGCIEEWGAARQKLTADEVLEISRLELQIRLAEMILELRPRFTPTSLPDTCGTKIRTDIVVIASRMRREKNPENSVAAWLFAQLMSTRVDLIRLEQKIEQGSKKRAT